MILTVARPPRRQVVRREAGLPPLSVSQFVDKFVQVVREGLHLALRGRIADGHPERGHAIAVR